MPETTPERLVAVLGVVAAIALFFLAFSARTKDEPDPIALPTAETAAPLTNPAPIELPAEPVAPRRQPEERRATSAPLLVLTAARGDCWVSARRGSADGALLYEGTLVSGRSLRLDGARLWLRFGAAANLDLTLNGKKIAPLPDGTVNVVATSRGIEPAA
jgi:hypothetical protein